MSEKELSDKQKDSYAYSGIGLIVIILFIVWFLWIKPNYATNMLKFNLIFLFTAIIIGLLIYFSIKNKKFKESLGTVVEGLFVGMGKLAKAIADNIGDEEKRGRKGKKNRIPISKKEKNKVYDIANNRCQACGKVARLKIHHIDEDPSNNNLSNLILLCGNHHDDAHSGSLPKWRLKDLRKGTKFNKHTIDIQTER
ncbi:MAG: hypothetical protein ABH828_02100 [archaeon]